MSVDGTTSDFKNEVQDKFVAAHSAKMKDDWQNAKRIYIEVLSTGGLDDEQEAFARKFLCEAIIHTIPLGKDASRADKFRHLAPAVVEGRRACEIQDRLGAVAGSRSVTREFLGTALLFSSWYHPKPASPEQLQLVNDSIVHFQTSLSLDASNETAAKQLKQALDTKQEYSAKTKSGCFVATAACGNPFAPEVLALTAFRDQRLNQNILGRLFVSFYYRVSPPLAEIISRSTLLRRAALLMLVKPAARAFGVATSHSRSR